MPEHQIRLRAAWEARFDRAGGQAPVRVDLPAPWPPGPERAFQLRRGFQSPRIDPARETVRLRLADVPGLTEARLNGEALIGPIAPLGAGTHEFPLANPLPQRNLLELEIDPSRWNRPDAEAAGTWGRVALVIVPIG